MPMMLSAQHAQLDRQLDRHTEEQGEGDEAWQQVEGLLLPVLSHFLCVCVCECVQKYIPEGCQRVLLEVSKSPNRTQTQLKGQGKG